MALTLVLGDQLHREWLEASPLLLRAGQPVLPASLEVPFWQRLAAELEAGHPGQGSGLQVAEIADRGFEQLLQHCCWDQCWCRPWAWLRPRRTLRHCCSWSGSCSSFLSAPIALAITRRSWPACGNGGIRATSNSRLCCAARPCWSSGAQAAGSFVQRRRPRPRAVLFIRWWRLAVRIVLTIL